MGGDGGNGPPITARLRQALKPTLFKALVPIERANRKEYRLDDPPGFVIGPPRSATTLVRHLISSGLRTSYFSNLTTSTVFALGYPLPLTTAWIVNRMGWAGGRGHRFHNSYGKIDGPGAPTEGEVIWGHWFGTRYDAVAPGTISNEAASDMYRAVAGTAHILGAPFVNKTTALSLRLQAMLEVFPDAYFLRLHRDPLDIAQSIYIGRTTRYDEWLGARPPECVDMHGVELTTQVATQVFHIERRIDESVSRIGADRFLDVPYADVCDAPQRMLSSIVGFMKEHGVRADQVRPVPDRFEMSAGQKVDDVTYAALRRALNRLAG